MREVKFRAWDKKDKVVRDVVGMSFYHESVSVDIEYGKYLQDDAKRFELLQYTGLLDKNGTEIYEGDLVDFNGLYEIRFGKHGVPSLEDEQYVDMAHGFFFKAQHDMKDIEPFGMDMPLNEMYAKTCEVIGNVHQHGHLLERD